MYLWTKKKKVHEEFETKLKNTEKQQKDFGSFGIFLIFVRRKVKGKNKEK